jgi:hypothetical protein
MIFVLANIIGDVGNIALWYGIPSLQVSLQDGFIAGAMGAENALAAGTIILATVSAICAVALFGLFKGRKWSPYLSLQFPWRIGHLHCFSSSLAHRFSSSGPARWSSPRFLTIGA